ncbi:RidA family protein [Luteibacter anthropi]|uniref:RidA family protein n=1 Tax=Luteibacter anthropi TaxID=564369 RepID=UPI001ABA7414
MNGSAEGRLAALGLSLPPAPTPFGSYVEAVRVGDMVYFSGMLPAVGHDLPILGRLGAELTVEEGHKAAQMAVLSGLSAARAFLGSLDRVTRVAKLGVYIATAGDFREHPRVADGASDVMRAVFGEALLSGRVVLGVASLPLGVPVEVELLLEAAG